jgi:hypothetical protein
MIFDRYDGRLLLEGTPPPLPRVTTLHALVWQQMTDCVACTFSAGPHVVDGILQADWAWHYHGTHGWTPDDVAAWITDSIKGEAA